MCGLNSYVGLRIDISHCIRDIFILPWSPYSIIIGFGEGICWRNVATCLGVGLTAPVGLQIKPVKAGLN